VTSRNLICIAVERLHAGAVGAYGNSWIGTAALDDLASQAFVFDQAYLEHTALEEFYRAAWYGSRAGNLQRASENQPSLPQLLKAGGWHTALVTDSAEVASLLPAAEFAEQLLVEPAAEAGSADDPAETEFARLFSTATEWLAEPPREPFCLWLHSRGMSGAWDAPLAMRNRFAEEDDPEPPKLVTPPNHWLPDEFDPDEPLGIKHAYSGQVVLLDVCLGTLIDQVLEGPLAANTAIVLVSTGGFSLGEHRRIGPCDEALYNELAQLVLMLRFPDGLGRLGRSQALVQPTDLPGTIVDWLQMDRAGLGDGTASSLLPIVRGEKPAWRDHLRMTSKHDRALRTRAWHLRQPLTGAAELYAKPGDRWEVNEVAKLLPEVAEGMQAVLAAEVLSPVGAVAPLAELLTTELD
jgi:arylsulfatase A-like enzyme